MEKTGALSNGVLTVSGAALRLGIRLESVYRLIYAGLLSGQRVDGKWEIPRKSVERYATKHSRKERLSTPLEPVSEQPLCENRFAVKGGQDPETQRVRRAPKQEKEAVPA